MLSSLWVGLMQSGEGLNRAERLTLPQVRGNYRTVFELAYQPFSAFRLKWKHQVLWDLYPAGLQTVTTPIALLSHQPAKCTS